jgi:hypothetical protein
VLTLFECDENGWRSSMLESFFADTDPVDRHAHAATGAAAP